jgi:hypothetical protein
MQAAIGSTDNPTELEVSARCRFVACVPFVSHSSIVTQAELMSVASALRHLPSHGDQSAADSVTHELAVLFESFSSMLARNVSAASAQAAVSAGVAAAAALSSPFRPIPSNSSNSPTHAAAYGSALSRSTAEVSFLSISREVEVSISARVALPLRC